MLLFFGVLILSSLVQGQIPPGIVQFAESSTGKVALDQPNDVKASTSGFKLLCNTTGSTPITFSWKLNDKPLSEQRGIYMTTPSSKPNEQTLTVESTTPRDDGSYQCFAKNAYGATFSAKIPIRVTYASYFEETSSVVKKVDVVLGRSLRLICPKQQTGFKNFGVVYMWARKKDTSLVSLKPTSNRALLPNGNYLFLQVSQEDIDFIQTRMPDRAVQCVINAGNLIYFSHQFKFNVIRTEMSSFGPDFQVDTDRPKSQEQAIQGKSKALFCAAVGYPVPKITWYRLKDDRQTILKEIEDGKDGFLVKDFGRKLVIYIVSHVQHEGYYQCMASNGVGQDVKSPPFRLEVFVAPLWTTEPPKVLSVSLEADDSFKCEALGSPQIYYKWYHNGKPFRSSDELAPNVLVDGKYLRFKNMQNAKQGVFQCVVQNDHGMLVSSTWVKVKTSKPEIQTFGPFYLFKGTTATLKCESNAAPKANNIWFHNGTQVEIKGRFSRDEDGSLVIREVYYSDAGRYKCSAQNTIGKDEAEAEATVYEKTTISLQPPPNATIEPDKPFELECKASADQKLKGSLKYKWLKDNAPMKYDDRVQWDNSTYKLTIIKVAIKDGAKYTCVAYTDTEQYSEDKVTTTADVKGVPFPPYDLKITDCSNETALITWKKGQDNNSPTTEFIIEQESSYYPAEWKVIASISDPDKRYYSLKPTLWADLTFRMRAVNKIGTSRGCEPTPKGQCVTSQGLPTMSPENLRGIPGKAGELYITWTAMTKLQANAPGLYYTLYYGKADSQESFSSVVMKDPQTERFSVPNAGIHVKWNFKIAASNKVGQGPISDIKESFSGQNAPQVKPMEVNVTNFFARSIELSWKRVDISPGNIDGYKIYYWREGSSKNRRRKRRDIPSSASVFTSKHTSKDRQTATVTGLTPSTSYTLAVKAFNSGGEGPSSDEHSFDTKPDSSSSDKPFEVKCGKDNIKIALKSSEFGQGNFQTESATLRDVNCKAKQFNNTHVYMETPLDGCGTYHNYSSDGRYLIYYNQIVLQRRTSQDDSALITRDHDAVFEFECRYHRSAVMSVVHYSPSRATVYTATENFGNFTFMMRMFKTNNYKEVYQNFPVYVVTNEDVFMQTEVKAKDADLVLLVDSCTATPSKDSNDKDVYDLIKAGCAKDETLKYDHKLSPVQRFNFKAFYFNVDKQGTVHIHCTVRVCRKADKNSRCVKGCSNDRLRRAAGNAFEEDEITGSLSIGPLQLEETQTGRSTASNSPKMFVELVVGVLGFFVAVLLVAVIVVILKKRQQPRKEALSLMVDDSEY